MKDTRDDSSKKGEKQIIAEERNEKLRGGKCQTRSCLVPAGLAVMDGLQWEVNTSFKLAISTIYNADEEKKKEGGQLHSLSVKRDIEESVTDLTGGENFSSSFFLSFPLKAFNVCCSSDTVLVRDRQLTSTSRFCTQVYSFEHYIMRYMPSWH